MIYGENLEFLREQKNLTLIQMAKLLNISDSLYSRYEKEIQLIPIKHLNYLCNYFNVSLDFIFKFAKTKNYKKINKDINMFISGNRLKELRKELKLTQKELAEILHIARGMIGEYEKGNYIISTHSLYDLCKKYHISADYLLGKIDSPKYLKN